LPEGGGRGRGSSGGTLLENLNEQQREAVTHDRGPLLIIAGPGSGKTRVVTSRVAWLILERGVRPDEILAVTFTNKAAREMRERAEVFLGGGQGLWISTFHSMCARILRSEIGVLGPWTRDFSIHDTSDRNQLLKTLIRDLEYDLTEFRPAMVGGWISEWKNKHPGETPRDDGGFGDEVLAKVFAAYRDAMRAANALDFDDLLLLVLEIFNNEPGVRDSYASRFRHVMVDEYQDTNRVQYLLTRHLSSYHGNLAVCGDPDQSIYAWRGADIANILDFEKDYGDPKVVVLGQNYRSTGNILRAAGAVIGHNRQRKAKELSTGREDGALVHLRECGDENDEGREIVEQIRGLVKSGTSLGEIALLYRANFMQRALESQLRLAKIPYQVVAGLEFYSRREIRDLVSHLKLLVNPADDVAFRRVVNVPRRGVGDKSLERLSAWAKDRRCPLLQAASSEEALGQIRGRAKKGLAGFAALMARLEEVRGAPAAQALDLLIETIDFEAWMAEIDQGNREDREANVEELRAYAADYDRLNPEAGLRGMLEDVSLVSDADDLDEEVEQVRLMTLHAAKGLEFSAVFIAGLEEELLPHFRAVTETTGDEGLEEERRLFYVGMTRARDRLFLTYAAYRMHFGETTARSPSRFIDEIPPELLEGYAPDAEEEDLLGVFDAPPAGFSDLRVGDRVRHDHFGNGTIERLLGSGVNARATVHFPRHGAKELLLQYANLEVLR
jgi:DNA helicase II / ATP-dependent DNA helicase PcrA